MGIIVCVDIPKMWQRIAPYLRTRRTANFFAPYIRLGHGAVGITKWGEATAVRGAGGHDYWICSDANCVTVEHADGQGSRSCQKNDDSLGCPGVGRCMRPGVGARRP